jgi:adenylyl- and sulfurtransferase ThiI
MEVDKFISPPNIDERSMERRIRRQVLRTLNELRTEDFEIDEIDVELEADVEKKIAHRLGRIPGQVSILPLTEAVIHMSKEIDNEGVTLTSDVDTTVRLKVIK